jgi:hypothetical protein
MQNEHQHGFSITPLILIEAKNPLRIAGLSAFVFAAILPTWTPHVPGDSDAALALADIAAGFGGRIRRLHPNVAP